MITETRLTNELLQAMQRRFLFVETHAHLPGLVTPELALQLAIGKNGWIDVETGGPLKNFAHPRNPHRSFDQIFAAGDNGKGPIIINGKPAPDLRYNMEPGIFDDFDRVLAIVHGHRYREGAIMDEEDVKTVLRYHLAECKRQGIRHTEIQLNIGDLADHIYKDESNGKEAKIDKFCTMLSGIVKEFAAPGELSKTGVNLCFLHCFNKTTVSGKDRDLEERAIEAAELVIRLNQSFPFIIGLQTAGNEDMYDIHKLKKAYEMVRAAGLETGAHAGEGKGALHVIEVLNTIPLSNLGHGFRAIELEDALRLIADKGLVLHQCPIVNDKLGAILRMNPEGKPDIHGSEKIKIGHVYNHPFFPMLREHGIRVNLCSDNPGFFGSLEEEIKAMAGITIDFPKHVKPLTLEELIITNLHGVAASAMPEDKKISYARDVLDFIAGYSQAIQKPIRADSHSLLAKAVEDRPRTENSSQNYRE